MGIRIEDLDFGAWARGLWFEVCGLWSWVGGFWFGFVVWDL